MKIGNYDGFNKGADYGCLFKTREEWEQSRHFKKWISLHRYYDETVDGPYEHVTYKRYRPDKNTVSYRLKREAKDVFGYALEYDSNVIYETETRYEVMVHVVKNSKAHNFLIEQGFTEF